MKHLFLFDDKRFLTVLSQYYKIFLITANNTHLSTTIEDIQKLLKLKLLNLIISGCQLKVKMVVPKKVAVAFSKPEMEKPFSSHPNPLERDIQVFRKKFLNIPSFQLVILIFFV
jgi:hypothetical protein